MYLCTFFPKKLNQWKGENDWTKYFTINLDGRMLPDPVGIKPTTSWSLVRRASDRATVPNFLDIWILSQRGVLLKRRLCFSWTLSPDNANPDMPCLCKQWWSRSVGFWRNPLIWICTVCQSVCEFVSTILIKSYDWLKTRSGHGILIYSAWQWL